MALGLPNHPILSAGWGLSLKGARTPRLGGVVLLTVDRETRLHPALLQALSRQAGLCLDGKFFFPCYYNGIKPKLKLNDQEP